MINAIKIVLLIYIALMLTFLNINMESFMIIPRAKFFITQAKNFSAWREKQIKEAHIEALRRMKVEQVGKDLFEATKEVK